MKAVDQEWAEKELKMAVSGSDCLTSSARLLYFQHITHQALATVVGMVVFTDMFFFKFPAPFAALGVIHQ